MAIILGQITIIESFERLLKSGNNRYRICVLYFNIAPAQNDNKNTF